LLALRLRFSFLTTYRNKKEILLKFSTSVL
jgi:hypothetical protein